MDDAAGPPHMSSMTSYSPPTAALQCVSAEKATELAALLVLTCGCPASAAGSRVIAPIDHIAFVFRIVDIAVTGGFASDIDAVAFQRAGIDLVEARQ